MNSKVTWASLFSVFIILAGCQVPWSDQKSLEDLSGEYAPNHVGLDAVRKYYDGNDTLVEFWNEPGDFGVDHTSVAMLVVNNQNQSLTLRDVRLECPRSTFNVTFHEQDVERNESAGIGVVVYPEDLQVLKEKRVERCEMIATLDNKSFTTNYAIIKLARNEQRYYLLSPAYRY